MRRLVVWVRTAIAVPTNRQQVARELHAETDARCVGFHAHHIVSCRLGQGQVEPFVGLVKRDPLDMRVSTITIGTGQMIKGRNSMPMVGAILPRTFSKQ